MTDGRQTAAPGIYIESIKVSGKAPPDRPGMVEEFVSRGMTKEFEVLQRAADITTETIGDTIADAEEMVGPLVDEFFLEYNLKVKGLPGDLPVLEHLQKRSVSGRARAFARAKNPTELEVFEVSEPVKDEALSGEQLDVYDVTVTVTK